MFNLKILFAFVLVASLTACSSNPSSGGADGTDLRPLGGQGGSDGARAPQYGDEFDMGVEIMGVELGDSVNDGSALGSDVDNMMAMEMQPIIYFAFDESELSEKNTEIAKHYAQTLLQNPNQKVILKGHTDERGSPEYNLALGERRAKSVERVMMLFGVTPSQIDTISFGEEQPAEFAHTEEAWDKNRRVEIIIQ